MCNSGTQKLVNKFGWQLGRINELHQSFQEAGDNNPTICKHCSELSEKDVYWPCKSIRVMEESTEFFLVPVMVTDE